MSEFIDLPLRKGIPEELTWDLKDIFETDEDFERAIEAIFPEIDALSQLEGSLNQSSQAFLNALEHILSTGRKLEALYLYAQLKHDQDTSQGYYQDMYDRVRSLNSRYASQSAWFEAELLSLDERLIEDYLEENQELSHYTHYLERLIAKKEHTLTKEEEALLAAASDVLSASGQTFAILNNSDLDFPLVENEQGEKVKLSHGNYSLFLESKDRAIRKEAFQQYHYAYESLENTFASTLSGTVKSHNFTAQARHYSSAREAALFANFIPESVYDSLLEAVREHLPSFHRYLKLRKKVLNLDELHMYDLYAPLTDADRFEYNYEEAQAITLEALAPLGKDYQAVLQKSFDERWIDVCENKGKRSGAYSSGIYDSKPYILLNWQDSLNNLYTLVHELGHSVHSYLSHQNQSYIYGDYPIFLAEIASTTNENLLTHYLLQKAKNDQEKITILNQYLDGFKGSVYRQTQFAEFEHLIHLAQAEGKGLTADFLNQHYYDLNQAYYGDDVVSDSQIAKEWSRVPHFYYNYYVYQYATGFCAASALAQQILTGERGRNAYLGFLKAGQSDYPIEVMKKAGVDMTDKKYLEEAFRTFDRYLGKLEDLLF